MTGPALDLDPLALAALGEILGSAIVATEPVTGGFTTPTATVRLATGERVVVQRHDAATATRIGTATRALAEAGLAVPAIRGIVADPVAAATALATDSFAPMLVIYEHVEGTSGPEQLDGPAGLDLARAMAAMLDRLRAVDPARVPIDPAWASPAALLAADATWRAALPRELADLAPAASLGRVARRGWQPALTHGDFVPANVVVDGPRLAALLDLGDVARRHPLVDPAWWGLIVRHHHPAMARDLFAALLAARAGGPGPATESELADVAAVRAFQRLALGGPGAAEHATALLSTATVWAMRARHRRARPRPE